MDARPPTESREETTRLLLERTRAGLWVTLACVLLFALGDLDVSRSVLPRLYAFKGGVVALIVAGLFILGRTTQRWVALTAAFLTVNGTYAAIAATDVMAGHLETTPLLAVACGMAAAALLPWGLWPQLATAAFMCAGNLWTLRLTGRPLADLADPATSVTGALGVSVYAAYEFARYRNERQRAEVALGERAQIESFRGEVRLSTTGTLALDDRLRACSEAIVERLDAAFARIWILDADAGVLELRASSGLYTHIDGAHSRVPLGQRKIGRIAEEQRPHVTNAVTEDEQVDREWARREGMVSFAGYPLVAQDRVLGVVAMFARHPLTDATREALASVAEEIAFSIERSHAEEALAYWQTQLEDEAEISAALARIGQEMISSLDTPVLLDRLCQVTAEVLTCDYSATLLWHAEGDEYALVASHGLDAAELRGPVGRPVPRETASALFSGTEPDDVAAGGTALPGGRQLCIALRRGKDMIGVLHAGWRDGREVITAQRRRIAEGLARAASMALANARLFEELERASRLKSEFLSTMSHELRTPLNVILGYTEMARDPGADGERDGFLERIETAGRDLLELIDDTLEIGRIEAGRADVQLETVSLDGFWAELGRVCAKLPRRHEVALTWELAPAVVLVTDPRKLAIVVRNLVGNALKFTERGEVRAGVRATHEAVVLEVQDTGVGIRPEDREVIFEMFRQADGSETRRFGGTGLGLYIVRRFVQQIGGSVSLDSEPGRGSVFRVTLPLERAVRPVSDAA
jgi:signal transduction histidine kinase